MANDTGLTETIAGLEKRIEELEAAKGAKDQAKKS
jgi:hypothetical protein